MTTMPVQRTSCLLCSPATASDELLDGLLRRCASCAFAWTVQDTPPSMKRYDDASLGEDAYLDGGGHEEYPDSGPRRFEAGRRLRWLSSVASPKSLVEAGAVGGFFVAEARRAGIAAEGRSFETTVLPRPVEAVCAFRVLEHVDDPREFLRAAHAALVPGGWLALEVPNFASAGARRFGTAWGGLQPRHQRWHFGPDNLTRLVTASGFRVIHRDTIVLRYYLPLRHRLRHAYRLLPPDLVNVRSPWLTHPRLGDLLRLVARRDDR